METNIILRRVRNSDDTTILSVILQDFKKQLSRRSYSDTQIDPIVTTIAVTGADRNEILKKSTANRNSNII